MTPDQARLSAAQINALVKQYVTEALQEGEEDRASRVVSADEQEAISLVYAERLAETQGELTTHDLRKVSPTADELLQAHGIQLDPSSPEYHRLCLELLKAQQVVFKIEMERWEGNYLSDAPYQAASQRNGFPAPSPPSAGFPPSSPTLLASPLLSQGLVGYLEHIKDRAPATLRERKAVLQKFAQAIGDKSLGEYTKRDLITYRDSLKETKKGRPLSRSRVNTVLGHLSTFFSWTIKHDYHAGPNPVTGLTFENVEDRSHDSFGDEALSVLFTHPDYLQQRSVTSSGASLRSGRYWLPLCLLFSGARREEIAGCPLEDLKEDPASRVLYFNLRFDKETGRRLKNKASIRRVPVHSALLQLGFLDYVQQVKDSGATILFPSPLVRSGTSQATSGGAVGKWFARLIKQVFPTDKRKLTLHSLRSTAITRLHDKGIKGEIVRALVGHSGGDIHEDKYLKRDAISLSVLRDAIEQLDFPLPERRQGTAERSEDTPEKPAAKALSHALTWSRRS